MSIEAISGLLIRFIPALAAAACLLLALWLIKSRQLRQIENLGPEARLPGQMLRALAILLGLIVVLLVLPLSDATRGQILSLVGVVLTAVIALSSTTFVSNAMAGLMLRAVNNFRPGDFVRIGDLFGRVTERGLFHTEVQTEDRDLTTFPNLYFVNNPVTVVRRSGTIVSATVSLGYDVSRVEVETLLKEAAAGVSLDDAFVQISELGDFSINYRVAGFLPETTQILTSRSNLRKKIIDVLHDADIEIVSPTYMTQTRREQHHKAIAKTEIVVARHQAVEDPESLIFDKGTDAAEKESLRARRGELKEQLKLAKGSDDIETDGIESEIVELDSKLEEIKERADLEK